MFKCPYCFEKLIEKINKCPHCIQFIIDPIINSDFPSLDKKSCIFCGKKIFREAKICRFCRRWLVEVDQAAGEIDPNDLV